MGNLFNFDKSQMYYLQNDEIYLICMCESQIKKKNTYMKPKGMDLVIGSSK